MFWHSRPGNADTNTFLLDDTGQLTYRELFEIADNLFLSLNRGVMAIVCEKNSSTIIGYIGALRAGLVPLLLDSTSDLASLLDLIERYQVEYLWAGDHVTPDGYDEVKCFGPRIPATQKFWKRRTICDKQGINPDLAALIPTSGSTGDPKSVRLSQRNLASVTSCIADYLGLDATRRAISLLPLQYSYGLSVLNTIMEARGSYVITDLSPVQRDFWDLVITKRVTDFSAVPFVFNTIKRMRFSQDILDQLVCVTQAGGHLSPTVTRHFRTLFEPHDIAYFTMYGATEASPRIAYLHPDDAEAKHGSVGKPISIGAVTLDGAATNASEGELVYRGPNVCLGYAAAREDLARGDDFAGILRTGDMARIDDDGFIYITVRLKRFVKIHGVSVNLEHVESVIRDGGFDCHLIGRENLISVVSQEDYGEQILHFAKKRFNFHPSIWRSLVVDHIPLTSSDKVDYASLDRMTGGETHAPG